MCCGMSASDAGELIRRAVDHIKRRLLHPSQVLLRSIMNGFSGCTYVFLQSLLYIHTILYSLGYTEHVKTHLATM